MKPLKLSSLRPEYTVIFFIALYIATFGLLAMRQHLAYETGALDLGNYDQAMWNLINGRGLALTTLPNISLHRMGLHVEPILYLVAPIYWLWPGPLTLLWLQTVALGLAAWPLFLLARRRVKVAGRAVVIVLAYLLLPATQAVNLFDFHAVALSPLFMLTGLYFLDNTLRQNGTGRDFFGQPVQVQANVTPDDEESPEKTETNQQRPTLTHKFRLLQQNYGNLLATILFLGLAMSTKEDISLHVFMVGVYLTLWLRQWRLGIFIAGYGLGWAYLAFGVVIPAYRIAGGQSAYVKYFPGLGETPLEIALSPLTKPVQVWQLITRPENIAALQMLTLPFAFLNLLGLPIFVLCAPSLSISLLSNNPLQQALESWHYAAPMLPFISLAAADGLARLSDWGTRLQGGRGAGSQGDKVTGLQGNKYSPICLFLIIILLTTFTYHYYRGYSPLSKPFRWPDVTTHHQTGNDIAATIPTEARVMALAELVSRVSQRRQVTIWTGDFPDKTDYIFLDVAHPKFINQDNAQANLIATMIFDDRFGLTLSKHGYLILQKGAERLPTQDGFQDFLLADSAWAEKPSLAQFGDYFSLVGAEVHLNREAEPQMTLYFHVLAQPTEDYFLRLYLLNPAGDVTGATVFQQPVLVWWPTHLWEAGAVIKVRFNTLPWWTGDGQHPQFSYALGLSTDTGAIDDPWNVNLRLPVQSEQALPDNLVYLKTFERVAGMVYVVDK